MITWLFALLLFLQSNQPVIDVPDALIRQMAMTAKGEASNPVYPACVMRNRILHGWNPYKVLNHFYARPRQVTEQELIDVANTIRYGVQCDPRAYFQWSLDDERKIQPNKDAFLFEIDGNVYYAYHALRGR